MTTYFINMLGVVPIGRPPPLPFWTVICLLCIASASAALFLALWIPLVVRTKSRRFRLMAFAAVIAFCLASYLWELEISTGHVSLEISAGFIALSAPPTGAWSCQFDPIPQLRVEPHPGTSLNFPLLLAAAFLLFPTAIFVQDPKRPPSGLCLSCGYDLRASNTRCPECGTPIPQHLPRRQSRTDKLETRT